MLIMGLALVNSLSYGEEPAATQGSIWSTLGEAKDTLALDDLGDDMSPFALPAKLESREGVFGLDDQWAGPSSHHQARKWLSRKRPPIDADEHDTSHGAPAHA